MVFIDLENSLW